MNLFSYEEHTTEEIMSMITNEVAKDNWRIYTKIIPYENIEFSVLPQLKCVHCGFYGRCLVCPPFVRPYYVYREELKKYNVFVMVIGEVDVRERYLEDKNVYGTSEWRARYYSGNENTVKMKYKVNDYVDEKVALLRGFGYDTIGWDTGGGCRRCKTCNVGSGRCKKPNVAKPAPEATGIDLYKMMLEYDNIEIPPLDIYRIIGMFATNIPDYEPKPIPRKEYKIKYELPFESFAEYDAMDIYDSSLMNCKCDKYSPILCRKQYKEEDMVEFMKDKKLYCIRLENSMKTKKGINELYSYILNLHRQGVYWAFPLWSSRCPICDECNLEIHKSTGYKKVQNRRIPRCVKFFNLEPRETGEKIGYILL